MTRVVVTGGRKYSHVENLTRVLNKANAQFRIVELAHGDGRGADQLAGQWAASARIPVVSFPAEWDRLLKLAGPMRNERMLNAFKPHIVIAFPGGRGTEDCVARAIKKGVPVYRVVGPTMVRQDVP